MKRILVTGGSGGLGREVVRELGDAGYTVRIMSRRPRPTNHDPAIEWAQADLESGAGLRAAADGIHTIVHAASHAPLSSGKLKDLVAYPEHVDVDGTRRLLEHARAAGVAHVAYISIVGIDQVPMTYYRAKLKAEALFQAGGVPWTILRATQFFTLIDFTLQGLMRLPLAMIPAGWQFQPVDTREVAARLRESVDAGLAGQLPDLGGPQVYSIEDLARSWLRARGRQRRLLRLRLPGKMSAAIRGGGLTCPQHRDGILTWEEWIQEIYAQPVTARVLSTTGRKGGV